MGDARHNNQTQNTDNHNHQSAENSTEYEQPVHDVFKHMASADSMRISPRQVMQLQRQFGNQATGRILQRRGLTGKSAAPSFFNRAPAGSIQRADDDKKGGDAPADKEKDDNEKPGDKLELDGSDPEVKDQKAEIDDALKEANDIKAAANRALGGAGGTKPTAAGAVGVEDDDEDSVDMGPAMPDADTDVDDDSVGGANVVPKSPAPQHMKGKGQKVAGQLGGTKVAGQQLAAEGALTTGAKGVANTVRAGDTALDAKNTHDAIKAAIEFNSKVNAVDVTSDAASNSTMSGLEKVAAVLDTPPLNIVLPIASLLPRIHLARTKQKQMRAYKAMMEKGGGSKKEGKDKNNNLQSIGKLGSFGYAKTLQGFWVRVSKAAINVGQIITRIISLIVGSVTAGLGAIITEAVDAALSLSQGIIVMAQSLNALWKIVTGKRGKKRLEAANTAMQWALNGDDDILDLMVNGEVFGVMWWQERAADYKAATVTSAEQGDTPEQQAANDKKMDQEVQDKLLLSEKPTNNEEMKAYLEAAKRQNLLEGITAQLLVSLKST